MTHTEHHWIGIEPDPEEHFGFTYLIEHTDTGRFYVGKKQYHKNLTLKPLKGTKRKRKVTKPNDWEYYKGSSKHLAEFISEKDGEGFTFTILNNFKTKGGLYYGEVKEQVLRGCLELKDETGTLISFNRQIAAVRFVPKETK
jgi:hypothetical protein